MSWPYVPISHRGKRLLLSLAGMLLFIVLFLHPEESAVIITSTLENFFRNLLPVLFPYMVLSHIFCTYGLLDPLAPLLPVEKLFRMPQPAFSVFAMGHLCGYPVGGKIAGEFKRSGKLTAQQGTVLCAVSSVASPGYLIHIVGGTLWNDPLFGVGFLVIQILTGIAAGAYMGKRCQGAGNDVSLENQDTVPFSRCFCEAVGGSALQLISVCGYIVFFSLIVSLVPGQGTFPTVVASLLEFSTGTRLASSLGGYTGVFLTGFSVGFGGLSVFAQITHMLADCGISLRSCLLYKLFLGFVCGIYGIFYYNLHPELEVKRNLTAAFSRSVSPEYITLFFILIMALILTVKHHISRRIFTCDTLYKEKSVKNRAFHDKSR